MDTAYQRLLAHVRTITDLGKASAVLRWDRETNMPKAGDPARIEQLTTLRRLIHERSTSTAYGELIEAAAAQVDSTGDALAADLICVLRYDYARARRLPEDLVVRTAETSARARTVWEAARADADFARFQPWLEQLVEIQREMAERYGYAGEPYDALLEGYEQGATAAGVRAVFDAVKRETVPLVQAIAERADAIDDAVVRQAFPIEAQTAFARHIAAVVGYDFDRGHLGTVVHPFATSFSRDDVRITTRWYPDDLRPALFGTLHESGHAIYEQNTGPELARTPLASGTSAGIHESQSRMIENLVGRSWPFWRAHFPDLRRHFPAQLAGCDAEQFYRAVNKVQPSLIRVEADELTYNLHIILRFELEQALLGGTLAVADLPGAWNDGLRALLGVVPPNDREGVLQDVHWSGPSFGYFPTYALGNLYAAQLMEAARAQSPDVDADLDAGRTGALVAWLREHVHRHGRRYPPAVLIERATGAPLGHAAFVRYARAKFGRLYDLPI